MRTRLRILMPSIVDTDVRRGGAWTVTRGLVEVLRQAPWSVELSPVVPPEPVWRRSRQAACLLAALVTGVPAKVLFVRSGAFRDRVRCILAREQFDLLLINGSDLLWCLDEAPPHISTLAIVHNRESNLYQDQVAATTPRIRPLRDLLLSDGARLSQFEIAGLRRVQAAIFLSTSDAAHFADRIPGLDYIVLPPLFVDSPERIAKQGPGHGLDLGFLANFAWWPNRDALDWIIREVLTHLPADIRLHLFGHLSSSVAAGHPRIVAHGFVDDLREVWRSCDWMIVPTRFGSGVSVKTAESLYHGMPILSTPFGMRGLPAFDHPQIVVAENAGAWVSFLSSPRSRILCKERLPPEFSDRFAVHTHRQRFEHLLFRLLERRTGHPVTQ